MANWTGEPAAPIRYWSAQPDCPAGQYPTSVIPLGLGAFNLLLMEIEDPGPCDLDLGGGPAGRGLAEPGGRPL
jgi:hypothetical protein